MLIAIFATLFYPADRSCDPVRSAVPGGPALTMSNTDAPNKNKSNQGGVKVHAGFSTFSSADGGDTDPQEYARLLEFYDTSFRNIAEGEVVKGTVVKVTPTEVIVDVGFKSEGIIAIEEFIDENGQVTAQPGDTVDVLLERTEDRDGYVVLSREKAEKMKIWDEVEKLSLIHI